MPKTYIFEGNTTNAAIENGLKELKVPKSQVDIKILEENKKSFFSILSPRVVKVEFTLKDDSDQTNSIKRREYIINDEEVEKQIQSINNFLKEFIEKLPSKDINYEIIKENDTIMIKMNGEDVNYLIGYRAENMYALQTVFHAIANKNIDNGARVILDINGYRSKREEVLNNLAIKISKTVIRTGKSITLEPMNAYERKIIHTALQDNNRIDTHSIGKEPYRKIVVSLKK